jgi:CheY-like chemotaxis protein/tetratricopeptide (TPR) repeat protein
MTLIGQLLHQITDPALTNNERAALRCQLAKQFEDIGNYESAREAMGELWPQIGERPMIEGLDHTTTAEVLLRVGALTGWIGSAKQIEGAQELAKDLISESIASFEAASNANKKTEAQIELAVCYWREGAYDEARVLLEAVRSKLDGEDNDLKAVAFLRSAMVEKVSNRLSDALRLHFEAAPLFEASSNQTLKGRFHNEYGAVLMLLGKLEDRSDYVDRALIEYAAASYHFEKARHRRYQGCVENNLGFLFSTIGKFNEAHEHLDLAQVLFTSLKDVAHLAGVDETRARVFLAEGRAGIAERLARAAALVLERGGEQSLLAEALTTQGTALARLGRHEEARAALGRAEEVAGLAGDSEGAGQAALTVIEEMGERLELCDLGDTYERALRLLAGSRHPGNKERLLVCANTVLELVGALPSPSTWEDFSFKQAVRRYEARLIEGALRETGGVVSRTAQLLGLTRQSLDSMLHRRHRLLRPLRTPTEPRRSSLMFREDDPAREARMVRILHVEDDTLVANAVKETLRDEGWRVSTYTDGAAALKEIEGDTHYDLMIIDNQLPGLSGLELVSRARELPHRQQMPIIMLSATDEWREARRAGASAFLRKPEDVHALTETIARLLARRLKQI